MALQLFGMVLSGIMQAFKCVIARLPIEQIAQSNALIAVFRITEQQLQLNAGKIRAFAAMLIAFGNTAFRFLTLAPEHVSITGFATIAADLFFPFTGSAIGAAVGDQRSVH